MHTLALFPILVWGYALVLGTGPSTLVQASPVAASESLVLPDLYEASITELQVGLTTGQFTSLQLVRAYFARINEVNHQGARLNAVIEGNPSAFQQAAALDLERRTSGVRGPLHGIPILLKDNIATISQEGMNTTAGSYALVGSVVPRDATVVTRLRAAGAILLGKASLSEWSHFRGNIPSGWSGRGGQSTNPYYPGADPSGSSSGSAISSAIGLAAASLGTETDGSIVSPCSKNNVVGIKPTVGLTSRSGVIPISSHQDSVGPICRNVADAAILLSVIAGRDPLDSFSLSQPPVVPDYRAALRVDALRGARIGIPRRFQGDDPNIIATFNAAVGIMRQLGATIIDGAEFLNTDEIVASSDNEGFVLATDMKIGVNSYLSGLGQVPPSGVRSLADLITFNTVNPNLELIPPYYNDQSLLITAQQTSGINDQYRAALASNYAAGRTRGIDALLRAYNLDAILLPTDGMTPRPAAIAGYPIITVPLGFQPDNIPPSPASPTVLQAPGMPFGISFTGTAYSEFKLIGYAYAYEQATVTRLRRRAYPAAVPRTQLINVLGS